MYVVQGCWLHSFSALPLSLGHSPTRPLLTLGGLPWMTWSCHLCHCQPFGRKTTCGQPSSHPEADDVQTRCGVPNHWESTTVRKCTVVTDLWIQLHQSQSRQDHDFMHHGQQCSFHDADDTSWRDSPSGGDGLGLQALPLEVLPSPVSSRHHGMVCLSLEPDRLEEDTNCGTRVFVFAGSRGLPAL